MNLDLAQQRYSHAMRQSVRPDQSAIAATTGSDYRGGNVVTAGYGQTASRVLSNAAQARGESVSYRGALSVGRMS